ncbi:DNA-formamidopyrimidine glycosylase family protein [Citricoccus sp. GCM10030269]|uniref:DNA-formamidopyrimidine glycosylase family protein n=1 Tax=Citricoccus sp. GCM10030269 TaxID=3273388 RepID=UPI003620A55D
MPEGDSLVRLADQLRPVLESKTLVRTDFRTPQLATLDLSGRLVDAVRPWAKYLLFRAGDLTILSHLKMEGRWEAYPLTNDAGTPVTPRWRHPGWQARCVLQTERHQVVGFQLGLLEVVPTASVADRLAFLGPDLLDPDWDELPRADALMNEAVRRLSSDPDRPVGLALLDQSLVSGIGNIYRCEVLLLARLDPHRSVGSVPDLPGLLGLARDLMRANIEPARPGSRPPRRTTTQVTPDDGAPYGVRVTPARATVQHRPGRSTPPGQRTWPSHWVYGRQREGCLRCGGPVAVEPFGDEQANSPAESRTLYWCRQCQR